MAKQTKGAAAPKSQASSFLIAASIFNELLPQKSMLNATAEELLNTFEFKSAASYVNNVAATTDGIEDGTSTQEASSTRVRYQASNARPLVIPIRAFFNMRVANDDTFDYATATKEEIDALVPMYQHISEELLDDEGAKLPQTIKVISVRPQTIKDAADKDVVVYPISNYKMFQDEVAKLEAAEKVAAKEENRPATAVDVREIFRNQGLLRQIQLTGVDGIDTTRFPNAEPVKDIVAIVL
jgi:hypothetical protein